jgi:peptidase A4-like protein
MSMYQDDPTTRTPEPAAPPRRNPNTLLRLLAVGVLAFVVGTCSGRVDLPSLIQGARDLVTQPPAAPSAAGQNDATVAAVKDVIERANQAQQLAFARGDPTLMRDTATSSYYDELVQINRELANAGVTGIELTSLQWSDVSVGGTGAQATTLETWLSRYSDGTSDQRTDRNEYTLVQQNGRWRIQSDVQPDARVIEPGTGQPQPVQPGTPAQDASRSSNWSGYVATGGTFTSVSGSWVVPHVSPTTTGADATWVGIGGLSSRDLIQAGTQATVSGDGTVRYESWIEMLPGASRPVPLAVTAGDAVTVSLTQQTGNNWLIAMKNDTTGQTYSVTVQYASSYASADWVQEAPSAGRGLVPLDNFGTLQFTAGSAVRDGQRMSLAALGARAITMINGAGEALATPSTLGADGSSFTITRTDATNTSGNGTPRRRGP